VKSHIPATNNPARIEVLEGQLINIAANVSKTRLKLGKPVGAKDKIPWKRKTQEKQVVALEEAIPMKQATNTINLSRNCAHKSPENEPPEEGTLEELSPEEEQVPENDEISIHYVSTGEIWDRNKIVVDNIFSFKVALDITRSNDHEIESQTVEQCRRRNDWPKWKEAIQAELNSLLKREVFGPIVQIPEGVMPVGYKWVFVRKRNEKNKIIRYKARLVAQGFSQRPGIDYEETYSLVMDTITFRFLISLIVTENLDMRLMDVVTTYLYGSLDNDIYMKIPKGYKLPEAYNSKSRNMYSIKL
jgi:hypothetical protein